MDEGADVKQASIFGAVAATVLSACVPAGNAGVDTASAAPVPPMAPVKQVQPVRPALLLPDLADFGLQGAPRQGGVLRGILPAGVASLAMNNIPVAVDEDRRWIFGFDRDAPAATVMTVRMVDGRERRYDLAVAGGEWRIERINAPLRGAARSSEEFQRLRGAELEQIAKARAMDVKSRGWQQNFIWPVTGRFSGFFGSQRIYQGVPGSYHSGTDVAVPRGTPFVAPADGVVVLAAQTPFTLEGYLLIVAHGNGLNSAFLHCDRLDVAVGDVVKQGQRLGTVGSTGRATGPHMHWGMKWQDARIDPQNLVR